MIPGSGRSAEEGVVYPLQYSWVSLVAQLVKNPPAMQETWVQSLGWEDPLEKGRLLAHFTTTHSILTWPQISFAEQSFKNISNILLENRKTQLVNEAKKRWII